MENKRSKRRCWTKHETKGFLKFYAARKAEFVHPRKRRCAFENVKEDMLSEGYDAGITVRHLEVKMQTMLRAFKSAKDNAKATGAAPCYPPFHEEMEEIFGDKPIHSKSESLNVGSHIFLSESESPDILSPSMPSPSMPSPSMPSPSMPSPSMPSPSMPSPSMPSTSSAFYFPDVVEAGTSSVSLEADGGAIHFMHLETDEVLASTTSDEYDSPSSVPAVAVEKKNLSRSEYYKKLLKCREEQNAAADRRFCQRNKALQLKEKAITDKAERHREKIELFKDLFNI